MANTPNVRFEGFTGEWEERRLGELCEVTMGQSPDGSTYSDEQRWVGFSPNLDNTKNKNSTSWRFDNECPGAGRRYGENCL